MNSLFSVNVKTNEVIGEEFIIRKTDPELAKKQTEATAKLSEYQKMSGMPLWYSIIMYIFLLAAIAFIPAFMEGCFDVGFQAAYQRTSWALYTGVGGLIVGAAMYVIQRIRSKKVLQSPEVDDFVSGMGELTNKIKASLQVPTDCADVDVLCRPYKLKNGKQKTGNHFFKYFNLSFWVFKENENLCFASAEGVYGIPLSSITEIALIKKSVSVPQWNKDEPIKSERYKATVKANNYGMYFIKRHYSVRFNRHGEEWEILIPAYDVDIISGLTGRFPVI